jgi:hypothetical protein
MSKGNRNPPKSTQFKEGRSGNPKDRPRQAVRQVSTGSQFRKVAKGQISIEIEGIPHKMSRWDAYVPQIYNMALNRNGSAARLLDQLRNFPATCYPVIPLLLSSAKPMRSSEQVARFAQWAVMEKQTRLLQVHEAEPQSAENARYQWNSRKYLLM